MSIFECYNDAHKFIPLEVYMIDPIIFTIGNFSLRWYGVIVMLGVVVGSLLVERKLKDHGENSEAIWDALVWVLPIGILGARLWYVINATLGGSTRYTDNPVEILYVWNGGLHIFGGLLFGAAALLIFLNNKKLDPWLFLDGAGPAVLVGQGIGRIANFINQELYGHPTTLPWGIPIDAQHRLPQFANLPEAARFHPTFAYEMLWNFAAAGLLLWLARRYKDEIKPGTVFAGWLLLAGLGRTWIEFFRPDQPKIGDTLVSYSMLIAALMAITGAVMLLARFKVMRLAGAEAWEDEYKISVQPAAQLKGLSVESDDDLPANYSAQGKTLKGPAKKRTTKAVTARQASKPKADRTPSAKTQSTVRVKKTTKKSTK
jgi:phosphatidylglycerol---prolipoprotein diacylglyceryl transferase